VEGFAGSRHGKKNARCGYETDPRRRTGDDAKGRPVLPVPSFPLAQDKFHPARPPNDKRQSAVRNPRSIDR
jgi:hypothetical protein